MSRTRAEQLELGSDSFLDVMANMVGILIILVVMVGVRVKNEPLASQAPPPALEIVAPPVAAAPRIDLDTPAATARALSEDLERLAAEEASLARAALAREQELTAQAREANRRQAVLDDRRQWLGAAENAAVEQARQLASAQRKLEALNGALADAEEAAPENVRIESYPTPLSQTVVGDEIHFQLLGGRVVAIPVEALIAEVKRDLPQQAWKLRNQRETATTVGPVGSFRARYIVELRDLPLEEQIATGRRGVQLQVTQCALLPTRRQLGETVQEALTPKSQFRAALQFVDPKRTVVTLWVYPESFTLLRELRKELYRLGFVSAARPLPDGAPIAFSPDGSHSAAQ